MTTPVNKQKKPEAQPSAVDVATIAAALLPKGLASDDDEMRYAISQARKLAALAAEPAKPAAPDLHLITENAAKEIGYVSRNYRNQMRTLFAAFCRAEGQAEDPEALFAYHERRGWSPRLVAHLKRFQSAKKSLAARRPRAGQRKSA